MKYKVFVTDSDTKEQTENIIIVRKNTTIKTVVLKAVESHVEKHASDPLDFMRIVKSLHRESHDIDDFTEWLEQDLDLIINIVDLNNYRYYNKKYDIYTTSYEEGEKSYKEAWKDQLNEVDAQKDFKKYLPDYDDIVEHGNDLCNEESFLEEWEIEFE